MTIIKVSFQAFYLMMILGWVMMWPGFIIISFLTKIPPGAEAVVFIVAGISYVSFIGSVAFGFLYDKTDWTDTLKIG